MQQFTYASQVSISLTFNMEGIKGKEEKDYSANLKE